MKTINKKEKEEFKTLRATNFDDAFKIAASYLVLSEGEKEKVKEICDNLHIKSLAERNDSSPDVKPYIQETNTEWVRVDLSSDMKIIQRYIKLALDQRYTELRRNGLRLSDNKSLSQFKLQAVCFKTKSTFCKAIIYSNQNNICT